MDVSKALKAVTRVEFITNFVETTFIDLTHEYRSALFIKPHKIAYCLLVLGLSLPYAVSADVEIKYRGTDNKAIINQISAWLGKPDSDNDADVNDFMRHARKEGPKALQAIGYYHATIKSNQKRRGNTTKIYVVIDPGPPIKLAKPDIQLNGEAQDDPRFAEALAQSPLKEGAKLDHGAYESLKSSFNTLARQWGYFDAAWAEKRIEIDPETNIAHITLHYDSGIRYNIGGVYFSEESPVLDSHLQKWVPFEPGTPFESKKMVELNDALLQAGYFKDIRPQLQKNAAVGRDVPVRVDAKPRSPNEMGVGIGFATDTGPRLRLSWDKPYVNRYGHSLRSEAFLSAVKQSFSVRYKIPYEEQPQTDYFGIEAGMKREDLDDTLSRLSTIAISTNGLTSNGWLQSISLRWEDEYYEVGGNEQDGSSTLYMPGISWSKTVQSSPTLPRWGYHYNLRLMASSRDFGSTVDIQQAIGKAKWRWKFSDTDRLLARSDLGILKTNDFTRVPTSHRFFTGGDQTIRGFKYKSIAPENDQGDLIGGEILTVGSLEYVHNFTEKWGAAAFVDAGRAYTNSTEETRVGVGFGLRWQSPVGPLRVDIGFGVSEDDVPTRLHLTIGPEL